jgi:hypothetical protein
MSAEVRIAFATALITAVDRPRPLRTPSGLDRSERAAYRPAMHGQDGNADSPQAPQSSTTSGTSSAPISSARAWYLAVPPGSVSDRDFRQRSESVDVHRRVELYGRESTRKIAVVDCKARCARLALAVAVRHDSQLQTPKRREGSWRTVAPCDPTASDGV